MIPSPWHTLRPVCRRVAAIIFLLAILYAAWAIYASQRLAAQFRGYRAAGQPTTPADLAPPTLPDNENARLILEQLRTTLTLTTEERDIVDGMRPGLIPTLPLPEADATALRNAAERNAAVFPLAEKLRTTPRAAFPFDPNDPLLFPGNNLGRSRGVAITFATFALERAQAGDFAAALEHITTIQAIARVSEHHPSLIGHLVAVANTSIAAERLHHIACDLQLRSPQHPRGADRKEVITLINNLLDDAPLNDSFTRNLRSNRVISTLTTRRDHSMFMRPLANLQAVRYNNSIDEALTTFSSNNVRYTATSNSPPLQDNLDYFAFGPYWSVTSTQRSVSLHCRALVSRHVAATALAIRLYQLDHQRDPASLHDLLGNYLPALPVDPFDHHRAPLRYDAARRILYSVGEDGRDDGGAASPRPISGTWRQFDYVFPLYRVMPLSGFDPSTPATPPQTAPAPATTPAP